MGADTLYEENVGVDQGAHTSIHRYHGNFSWDPCSDVSDVYASFREGTAAPGGGDLGLVHLFGCAGHPIIDKTYDSNLASDILWGFRARLLVQDAWSPPDPRPPTYVVNGSWLGFKTYAVTMAIDGALGSSSVTNNSATISANFFPNTNVSTATVKMQYRVQGVGSFADAPGGTSPYSGYGTQNITRNLTGLTGSTVYEYKLVATRNTAQLDSFESSVATFTTAADAPGVTTVAASSVTADAALLNGLVDPNNISSRVRFGWQAGSDAGAGTWANYTSYQNFSGDGNQSFQAAIGSLAASTTYFFRALAEHPSPGFGSLVQGSSTSFTTSANPLAEAAEEDHMMLFEFDRRYGQATSVYFSLASPSASSSNLFVTTDPGTLFAVNDIKVSLDGGTAVDVAALGAVTITQVTNAPQIYKLPLSNAEMAAEDVWINIHDASGAAFRDALIHIRTKEMLGQKITDATSIGGNTPAVSMTGVGTSPGMISAGGTTAAGDITGVMTNHVARKGICGAQVGAAGTTVTLDAGASGIDDYYNGMVIMIIGSTGAAQSRVITDYVQSTKVATVHRTWLANPINGSTFIIFPGEDVWTVPSGGELAAVPTSTSPFGQFIQFLFQRLAYKRIQTATRFTMYKANSSDELVFAAVSDDGTTQTADKL